MTMTPVKKALWMTLFWVLLALGFNVWVYFYLGAEPALNFFTGYLIEKSLSLDNLFVFLFLFTYFQIPEIYQHKILNWGIWGALVMRAIFIFGGITLIRQFSWILYLLAIFLIFAGFKLFTQKGGPADPNHNIIIRFFRSFFPVTHDMEGGHFFIRQQGKLYATPLFLCLLAIETTDLIFAMDSIPAIFGITLDPFIVFTSNLFAILGLRSLYFALAEAIRRFEYLHYGLGLILIFIGLKMLASHWFEIPIPYVLGVIGIILAGSIIGSLISTSKKPLN
jgi:tellurite resistance protein TerC